MQTDLQTWTLPNFEHYLKYLITDTVKMHNCKLSVPL